MDRFELQRLRDLPIEGVAERLGLEVVRHKCLCPFHDDHHASMSFSVRRNTYRCFACGAHGGTIDLAMKLLPSRGGREGSAFIEATKWLADEHNVILTSAPTRESKPLPPSQGGRGVGLYARFFEHPWLSPEARRFLFEERRLDPRVVRWCRLTSWKDKQGVPWLQTPYYDREGKLIGIQNRNLAYSPSSLPSLTGEGAGGRPVLPRFRFPVGSECGIYNLPVLNLLRAGETLFITEGCSDCWAMLSAGHKAIAIPSATLLSKKDKALLLTLSSSPDGETERGFSFAMYPDNDAPGERLFLQLKEVLPSLVRHQLPMDCKDYSEYFILKMKNE